MKDQVETMEVIDKETGDKMIINRSDFDEEKHDTVESTEGSGRKRLGGKKRETKRATAKKAAEGDKDALEKTAATDEDRKTVDENNASQ